MATSGASLRQAMRDGLQLLFAFALGCGGATQRGGVPEGGAADGPNGPASEAGPDAVVVVFAPTSDAAVGAVNGPGPSCPESGPASDGGASSARMPVSHRPASPTCPASRGPGVTDASSQGPPAGSDCRVDGECTAGANGRCLLVCGPPGCGGLACSYDECFDDSACDGGLPCLCRSSAADTATNYCGRGSQCAIDSDCGPGGYCSPSGLREWCGPRYFCHTRCDTCLDDGDCPPTASAAQNCDFNPRLGHWACGSICGPPPP
jgi:hypothetical protein